MHGRPAYQRNSKISGFGGLGLTGLFKHLPPDISYDMLSTENDMADERLRYLDS